jgi:hypothetical protein
MSNYILEVLNRLIMFIPVFLLGLSIGYKIGKHKSNNED